MKINSPEHYAYLYKILVNAENLLNEARILHSHQIFRRPCFLAISALEEVEKCRELWKDPTSKKVFNHRFKLKFLNDASRTIVDAVIKQVLPLLDQHMTDEQRIVINTAMKNISDNLPEFNFTVLRNNCLYMTSDDTFDEQATNADLELIFKNFTKLTQDRMDKLRSEISASESRNSEVIEVISE